MKSIVLVAMLLACTYPKAQTCDCEKEFKYVQNYIEQNFAGYSDRVKEMSEKVYKVEIDKFITLSKSKYASDNCPLIISDYLAMFKSHHLGLSPNFDPSKIDTAYSNQRPRFEISDVQIENLRSSTTWEGVYNFMYDSSTKIAVVKDPTPLHDYVGIVISSTRPDWKRGMVKFEGKMVKPDLLEGLLFMRNHRPKFESFVLHTDNTMISGDWRKDGAPVKAPPPYTPQPQSPTIDAKSLTQNTFYIKLGSFSSVNKRAIDSILKVNEALLNSTPNLILDLRNNGGGNDELWEPFIPYFYTNPIKTLGNEAIANQTLINIYKKRLEKGGLSIQYTDYLKRSVERMEKAKGEWVSLHDDELESALTPKLFPKKIVILTNRYCGSSTEQLLLAAKQSSKVILAGEKTIGNLDYSNAEQVPLSCFPYTVTYASTRSRRLNIGQGIDNIGIAPDRKLPQGTDWIQEALKILEP